MARYLFTDTQVRNFRREYEEDSSLTVKRMAQRYGTTTSTMCNILKGASYPHVPGAVKIRGTKNTGSRMNPAKREEMIRMIDRGYSTLDISIRLGVSTSTIHFYRHKSRDYVTS